ncbi:PPTA domain-containing protein, partial [Cephalotus follicularis]
MMKEDSRREAKASDLLTQLQHILESDPHIDEVGFIDPSQFVTLNNNINNGESVESQDVNENASFWHREHKLGISSEVLLLLYKAANRAFMDSFGHYKNMMLSKLSESECDNIEIEVMKHSQALLLLSSDFGTAWNSRKLIVSKKQHVSIFMDELLLSALVLSYSPKSENAWSHRRWVIKMIAGKCSALQEIIGKESQLVEKLASKMNYRAWNHRRWLVSFMTREQVLQELKKSRNWAGLHVADSSCFHYRLRLMLGMLVDCYTQENESSSHNFEMCQLWEEELDWNEVLIKRYVGREALWLHRRFLSLCWIRHFATDLHNDGSSVFLDNELCLVSSCSTIPDNEFDDFQAQSIHSAAYILWLTKHLSKSQGIELQEKLRALELSTKLTEVYPERSSLWDCL